MVASQRRFWIVATLVLVSLVVYFFLWRSSPNSALDGGFGDWLKASIPTKSTQTYDDSSGVGLAHLTGDTGPGTYHEITSPTTRDGAYFPVSFAPLAAMNPNIIPHPKLNETWIIVAQQTDDRQSSHWFSELVCPANFSTDADTGVVALQCIKPAETLPIAASTGDGCTGPFSFFGLSVGPHDARVFYGPENGFAIYGSNSHQTCFGQWMQDIRSLIDWGAPADSAFRVGIELHRPSPYGFVEKNWFVFWDRAGAMYVHHDTVPRRTFARLAVDGTVSENLAASTVERDDACVRRFLPGDIPDHASTHQATNSLAVTLCRRADPGCRPTDDNTFVFTIIQHKASYGFKMVYDPYVMIFRQREPFELFAFSKKPIWYRGRKFVAGEFLYTTSISWKQQHMMYHGYLDDVLFIGLGVSDKESGGIDVLAEDLLQGIGLCSDS